MSKYIPFCLRQLELFLLLVKGGTLTTIHVETTSKMLLQNTLEVLKKVGKILKPRSRDTAAPAEAAWHRGPGDSRRAKAQPCCQRALRPEKGTQLFLPLVPLKISVVSGWVVSSFFHREFLLLVFLVDFVFLMIFVHQYIFLTYLLDKAHCKSALLLHKGNYLSDYITITCTEYAKMYLLSASETLIWMWFLRGFYKYWK